MRRTSVPNRVPQRIHHAKRMIANNRMDNLRQSGAAQAQPSHVGGEQQSQGNGRGTDHQLEQLEPDDFVDE